MDRTQLAAGADGASVTADRLTDAVVAALADEQPHHLIEGQSLDVSGGENTERLFPSVDAAAWTVATDRRVLFVVPEAVETRTEGVAYDEIDSVAVEDDEFAELRVAAGDLALTLNARGDEPVGTAAAFVREQAATGSPVERTSPSTNAVDRGTESHIADGPQTTSGTDGGSRREESPAGDDPLEKLERLADLHERGVITEDELEARKRDLLDRL